MNFGTLKSGGFWLGLILLVGVCACDKEDPVVTTHNAAPVPDFTATPLSGDAPLQVQFEDLSKGTIERWEWEFGDSGGTSSIREATYAYHVPGTYTVTLTVIGPGGEASLTKPDFITVTGSAPPPPPPPPTTVNADFSATPVTGVAPLQVQFNDLTTCSGTVDSWSWDFGDGTGATSRDPAHTYASSGTYTVALTASSGGVSDTETKTGCITVSGPAPPPPPPPGPNPLVQGSLYSVGVPPGGLAVISDLEVFGGLLWMMEAQNPLATWGAKVYTFDGSNFSLKLSDSTSQGYLRGRVIGNQFFVPDGDPNGYAPGAVYVWSSASGSPVKETVTSAVHNFDVVQYNGQIYTTGGLQSGASSLNRRAGTTWSVASQGSFSRLKYAASFDGKIWASKRNVGSSAELVTIDGSMSQTGVDVIQGTEALCVDLQVINGNLYFTMWGQTGVLHAHVQPTTHTVTTLTGISSDLIWDYCVHSDGNIYGVAMFGIYGSQDGTAFTKIITVSDNRFGQPGGNNADGRASIASYNGKLYVGSSTNGTLYEIR
ncbi:MAG: PKD domain-containing protein [Planctomycetota bacterium]|jgi:PKD repeat protein